MINYTLPKNEQQIKPIEIYSKLKWKFNQRFNGNFDFKNENKHVLEIKRYLKENIFAIKAKIKSSKNFNWNVIAQLNNKTSYKMSNFDIESDIWYESILNYFQTDKMTFDKLNTVSLVSNDKKESSEELYFLSQLLLTRNKNINQFIIDENGINFKTPKIITNESIVKENNETDYSNKIIYNNVILFPQKMIQGIHNKTIFKVAIFNDDQEDIEKDIAILPNKIFNLPIENAKSLNLEYEEVEENEYINGYKIAGNINIEDFTYYDHNTQKTVKGISKNAQQGYIIPSNFSGLLEYYSDITINSDFISNIINFSQNIDKKYLDTKNALYKFIITKNDSPTLLKGKYIIQNQNFNKFKNNFITLDLIEEMYVKKDEEENN